MTEGNRPNEAAAPDPARSYERAQPEKEAGLGRLENNPATPEQRPDRMPEAVKNAQPPRQINAEEEPDQKKRGPAKKAIKPGEVAEEQPDHSMMEEEPDGWDLAPSDIKDPKHQRHPRREGKGGTP